MAADPTPVLAIAGLILVKEAGVPIPVPGDLVVLGAGVAAARGDLDPAIALVVIVAASVVGGAVQFALLRSVARPAMLRLLARFGATRRIESRTARLHDAGGRGVALARVTPGVRIVAIAASALAAVPPVAFLAGLVVGNAIFIGAHFALGYVVGEPVIALVGGALGPVAIAGIALAIVGLLGWLAIRARREGWSMPGRRAAAAGVGSSVATFASWADACCPACLVLGALEPPS
jgi:membrane protein DedA with SNARE-associated domain